MEHQDFPLGSLSHQLMISQSIFFVHDAEVYPQSNCASHPEQYGRQGHDRAGNEVMTSTLHAWKIVHCVVFFDCHHCSAAAQTSTPTCIFHELMSRLSIS